MKNGQKLKLEDSHVTPRIYSRSTSIKAWGCPRHPLLHQQKYSVLFQYTIFFIASYTMCYSWSVFVLFSVWFSLVFCSSWLLHTMFVWKRDTLRFHCLEHSAS